MKIVFAILLWSLIVIVTFSCTTVNLNYCTFTLSDDCELTIDAHKEVDAGVDTTPEALGSVIGSAVKHVAIP